MIKFSLKCSNGHAFDSWFKSGTAYDELKHRGMIVCPDCGGSKVEKALMAPAVSQGQQKAQTASVPEDDPDTPSTAEKLKALRSKIEASSEYVGTRFATEARAMYLGDVPDRPIYGEANPTEAKALIEEGVPVLPLPFIPTRKSN
ncbi:DUF1178 family protein [Roseinatronobacter sp.]|uniref:DUF1178 family protein n=1 Tax=Roseinatronobacter sp. TaxID=1945755 RepID=UPI0025D5D659|nr:DUF1178 family protein [Rhodobaca sp.]